MARSFDPDSLTLAQLDALNGRLDARRAEVGRQPVYCPKCRGLGIEWSPDYGDTSSLDRCRTCGGAGFMPRSVAGAGAPDWDPTMALAATLKDVARNQYKMSVTQNGDVWDLAAPREGKKPWTARVTLRVAPAKYSLVLEDGEHIIEGTGKVWLAIHHTSRGLPIDYHR